MSFAFAVIVTCALPSCSDGSSFFPRSNVTSRAGSLLNKPSRCFLSAATTLVPLFPSCSTVAFNSRNPCGLVTWTDTAALNGPQDCVTQMRELYKERRDVLIKGLAQAGWDMPSPKGSMFAWAPIPPKFAHLGSVEFSKLLLARAQVAVAPGLGFGEHGDGHVRIGLVENTQRLRQAIRNIRTFLHADSNIASPVLEATT